MAKLSLALRRKIAGGIPPVLGRFLYLCVFAWVGVMLYVRFARRRGFSFWVRNSIRTPSFRPGLSDLDCTLWIEGEWDAVIAREMAQVYGEWQRRFRLMGELNVYFAGDREWIARFVNLCEGARDPRLKEKLEAASLAHGRSWTEPSHADRLVYLLRAMESAAAEWNGQMPWNALKWTLHAERAGLTVDASYVSLGPKSPERPALDVFFKQLEAQFFEPGQFAGSTFVDAMVAYVEACGDSRKIDALPIVDLYWLIVPHRFVWRRGWSRAVIQGASASVSAIALRQIEWESTGLLAYLPTLLGASDAHRAEIRTHLAALRDFIIEAAGNSFGESGQELAEKVSLLASRLG